KNNAWIFDRIDRLIKQYNENYKFDIYENVNTAQLTRYGIEEKYDWHMDLGKDRSSTRKLTVVVELSLPNSYEGGNIEIFYNEGDNTHSRISCGDVIIFPSFVMHRAAEIKSGERWSLVFWCHGPEPFR
ncbi:MAG: 2OG-Fe(II) oxygenase, partial [Hyphomicrobiales bacterium]|nr:2OG-Fe(II) oxygenase [Hyphomicrobiales bacterium]